MEVRFADCRYDLGDPPAARARYLEGHIPGAAFLELDTELSDISIPPEVGGRHPLPSAEQFAAAAGRAGIGARTLVVAYDEGMTGGAARLWWLLRHFGHDNAAVLDGGLGIWLGPLAQGEEAIEPAVFTPRERSDDLITTEEIHERLGDPSLVLLDARPEDRYRGEALGLDPVAGHIPGAVSVPLSTDVRCRTKCSRPTRSRATADPAWRRPRPCWRCIVPAAPTRVSTLALGASGRARVSLQRLDAAVDRSLPCTHDLPDLDVGVGVALRARRERRLTRRP